VRSRANGNASWHNLGCCYNDARVIKWLWQQVRNGLQGGTRSFED
jgi:hypothetical protein